MSNYLKMLIIGLVLITIQGCAGMMGNMSADQLAANAKDKNSSVACVEFIGTGGKFSALYMNQEKINANAGGQATVKCAGGEVDFRDNGKVVSPGVNKDSGAVVVAPK